MTTNRQMVARILDGETIPEQELSQHLADQANSMADFMERTAHSEDKCTKGKNCVHGNPNVVRATRQLAMIHQTAADIAARSA